MGRMSLDKQVRSLSMFSLNDCVFVRPLVIEYLFPVHRPRPFNLAAWNDIIKSIMCACVDMTKELTFVTGAHCHAVSVLSFSVLS